MAANKLAITVTLTTLALSLMGCQPAKSDKLSLGSGRLARTTSATAATPNGKAWGSITSQAGDQGFWQELYYLTYPALSGQSAEEQLGYVSAQDGQATGVRFWGNANVTADGASLDSSSLSIRLEIYDDRTGTARADGTTRPDIPIQISPDQPTYISSGGTISGGQAQIYFQDQFGTIIMQGQISGQQFSGSIFYSDDATGGQTRQLGVFSVATCGFFVCH
jgi:hypothetical protein